MREDGRISAQGYVESQYRVGSEIGNQYFSSGVWKYFAQRLDGQCELLCTTIGQIISVDAGNDYMFEIEFQSCFGQLFRFVFVDRRWKPFTDSAKTAFSRANFTKNQKGCGSHLPAFKDVWAVSFLADGVKSPFVHEFANAFERSIVGYVDPDPGRPWERCFLLTLGVRCQRGAFRPKGETIRSERKTSTWALAMERPNSCSIDVMGQS